MRRQRETGDVDKWAKNELSKEDIMIVNELEELEIISSNNDLDLNMFGNNIELKTKNSKSPLRSRADCPPGIKSRVNRGQRDHKKTMNKNSKKSHALRRQESMGSQGVVTPQKQKSASFRRKNSEQNFMTELKQSNF